MYIPFKITPKLYKFIFIFFLNNFQAKELGKKAVSSEKSKQAKSKVILILNKLCIFSMILNFLIIHWLNIRGKKLIFV